MKLDFSLNTFRRLPRRSKFDPTINAMPKIIHPEALSGRSDSRRNNRIPAVNMNPANPPINIEGMHNIVKNRQSFGGKSRRNEE